MAIRFLCRECRQLLSIASRKAGTVIECPKCAAVQVVPDEETAEAAREPLFSRHAPGETGVDLADESQGLGVVDRPVEMTASGPPLPIPVAASDPPPVPVMDIGSSLPSDWILFRRHTIYVQGILFVLVAFVSLGLGVAIGRVSTYLGPVRGSVLASGDEPGQVLVEGRLCYDLGDGRLAGDQDSVLLFVPSNQKPAELIPIRGLRPQDPAPAASHRGLRRVEELGGGYARADATGGFHAVLPHGGKYYLLLISRHVNRPTDAFIDEVDREQIGKYFSRAEDLIGRSKYRWTLETFRSGGPAVMYNFGREGEE